MIVFSQKTIRMIISQIRKKSILFSVLLGVLLCFVSSVEARLIFVNEDDGTNTDRFYIDKDDTSPDYIDLEFGLTLDSRIRFDISADEFLLNRDLNFGGNELKNIAIERLASAPTCDGTSNGRLYHNTVDGFSYICNGTNWRAIDEDITQTLSELSTNIVILDEDDSGGDVSLQFGSSLSEYLRWDDTNQWFVLSDDLYIEGNEFIDFRVENRDGSVSIPACDNAGDLGKQYYDQNDGNAYVCIEPNPAGSPGVYEWFDFTATFTTTATKVVTVGTGGNYATIESAAGYLTTLTGGIILLTAETHNVTNVVDLENITLIGANTGDTVVNVTGNGFLEVKETQFKSLTLNIDAGITANTGLGAKYNAGTTSSVIFEWVDFHIGGTKYLLDSLSGTPPMVRTRFISAAATAGNQQILLSTASANLNAASTHFVESQSGSGGLDFSDWDVTISGSGNVVSSGTISTIPENTMFVYPGMNIQGAIDSLASGGFITLLPGIHNISSPISILTDGIEIAGYGDSTIIRASGFSVTNDTAAAIHIGATDGTNPSNDVSLRSFKLEVENSNIHGVRVAGGEDIQLYNLTIEKTQGVSGTGTTARMGIHMLDGTTDILLRPVISNCRIFGDEGAGSYFTDGIHMTGGDSYGYNGIWTNGSAPRGIRNALVEGNNIDYVRETVAVFLGVEDSSLFNNRFSRMGAGGGNSFGLFMGNSYRANMNANVVSRSLSTGSSGFVIEVLNTASLKKVEDSLFSNNTVDGTADGGVGFQYAFYIGGTTTNTEVNRNIFQGNVVRGASAGTNRRAFFIQQRVDKNIFTNNLIVGGTDEWDVGFDISSTTSDQNVIIGNTFDNVTTDINDGGTATRETVEHHRSTSNPTASDDRSDGFNIGVIWINTNTDTAYILVDSSVGSAVWNQIDGGGGGGGVTAVSSASDPTVNDDANDGYTIGTLWVNTTTDNSFILTDATIGAANWEQTNGGGGGGGVTAVSSASDPTVNDDANDGYAVGTLWVNTTTDESFILTDSTVGAANWNQIDSLGGGGGDLPVVQARRTTNFTIPAVTNWYDIPLDTTDVENDTAVLEHNAVNTERIDVKTNGLYRITYSVRANDTGTTHTVNTRMQLNGATVLPGSLLGETNYQGEFGTITGSFLANLSANDYVALQVQRTTANQVVGETVVTVTKLESGSGGGGGSGTASNTFVLDDDDTGGDVVLQFGSTLSETLSWDSANSEFSLTDNLDIDISGKFLEGGDGTANDIILNFDDGTDRNFGWDDDYSATHTGGTFSTFNEELAFRTLQSGAIPVACSGAVAGMLWMDVDTGLLYICDTSNGRNKWLGVTEMSLFGDESGNCTAGNDPGSNEGCNVDWGNGLGPDTGSDLGLYIPHPITITGYGFSADDDACSSGSFDVEVWSTGNNTNDNNYTLEQTIAAGLNNQAHNANNLNIDIAGDQYILWGIDNNCGQNIDDWNVILYFRYRE